MTPSIAEPPDLDRLAQSVTYAWTVYQNTNWPLLGRTLPRLLTTAQTAVAAYPGTDDQARRARTLLSQTYQVTACLLLKIFEFDLDWLAAERGFVLAEETGDSLLIGAATRQVVRGLMFLKHYDQSLEFARAGIDRLEPGRGVGSPAYLSLYGMLFLAGAATASHAHKPVVAHDFLDEGHSVARQLGYDGNEYFTPFGPTNAHLYRLIVCRELGDGAGVLSAARQVSMDDLGRLPKERRGCYYLNLAWGVIASPDALMTPSAPCSRTKACSRTRYVAAPSPSNLSRNSGVVRQARAHGSWNSSPHEPASRIMAEPAVRSTWRRF